MRGDGAFQVVRMNDWRYDYQVDNDSDDDSRRYQRWREAGIENLTQPNEKPTTWRMYLLCAVAIVGSVAYLWSIL